MHTALQYVWLSVNLLVLVSNGLLNGAVLAAVCYKRTLIQRRYGILISLAVADLLKIVPMIAQIIAMFNGPDKKTGIIACIIVSSVGLVLIGITILHLVFESINRLILITRPLRYDILLTPRVFAVSLACVWLIPIIGTLIPYAIYTKPYQWFHSLRVVMFSCEVVGSENHQHIGEDTNLVDHFVIYAVIITIVYFVIPIITMVVSYSVIFSVSLKHIRQLRKLEVKMKRLHRRYSRRASSAVFGSQFDVSRVSNASSLVTVDSNNPTNPIATIFSFRKRNSVAPVTSDAIALQNSEARTKDGITSARNASFNEVDAERQASSTSSGGTDKDSDGRKVLELLDFTRSKDDNNNNDNHQRDILDRVRNSQDSGHGTSSQISNLGGDNARCYDNENGGLQFSPMLIGQGVNNDTSNDEQPLFVRYDSNCSTVVDDNISEIEAQPIGRREEDNSNATINGNEPEDINVSTTDLYDLLAGFSVMGAYAETLRAKSATQRSSFARFQATIKEELRNRKQEIQLVKTLGGLLAAWILFYLPILIYSWDRLLESSFDYDSSTDLGRLLLVWALFNSALNPVIYCLRLTEFKNAVKDIAKKIKRSLTRG